MIEAGASLRGLEELRRKKIVRGESGGNGGPRGRRGKSGKPTVVAVPMGTLVWEEENGGGMLADLQHAGMRIVIARGGEGGRGNASLATSVRKTPRIAEKGTAGEERTVRLELRLLAEVGLVGLPNAGKSALLQAISGARPKVAAYPFTTLEPNLGLVEVGHDGFVVADIPGLIEGAHEGRGLGTEFLQHIKRTRVLVHVVDGAAADPAGDLAVARRELSEFGEGLAEKPWIVALNKQDLPEAEVQAAEVRQSLEADGMEVREISALARTGTDSLAERLLQLVAGERGEEETGRAPVVEAPAPIRNPLEVGRAEGAFEVRGYVAERIVEKLGVESIEAELEVVRRLRRAGVGKALRREGARAGDKVRVRGEEFEWPG